MPEDVDTPPAPLQNRIVGSGLLAVEEALFNPANWRIHPMAQQDALTRVLHTVGWVQQVVVNRTTGHLVDGHLRVQVADRLGEATVPCLYVELSEAEELAVLATLDPLSAMAAPDHEKMHELLSDLRARSSALFDGLGDLATRLHQEATDAIESRRVPDLDQMAAKYGEPNPEDFWPVIRLQVPPELNTRYRALLDALPGDDEVAKFGRILDAVDAAALGAPLAAAADTAA